MPALSEAPALGPAGAEGQGLARGVPDLEGLVPGCRRCCMKTDPRLGIMSGGVLL